jgi:hypothetical protein
VKNLIIRQNWESIALPVSKEFCVEMRIDGKVLEPLIKVFGEPGKVQSAIEELTR